GRAARVPGAGPGRGADHRRRGGGAATRDPAGTGRDVEQGVLRAPELRAVPEREVRALLAQPGAAGGGTPMTAPAAQRVPVGPAGEVTALRYAAAEGAQRGLLVLAHGAGA